MLKFAKVLIVLILSVGGISFGFQFKQGIDVFQEQLKDAQIKEEERQKADVSYEDRIEVVVYEQEILGKQFVCKHELFEGRNFGPSCGIVNPEQSMLDDDQFMLDEDTFALFLVNKHWGEITDMQGNVIEPAFRDSFTDMDEREREIVVYVLNVQTQKYIRRIEGLSEVEIKRISTGTRNEYQSADKEDGDRFAQAVLTAIPVEIEAKQGNYRAEIHYNIDELKKVQVERMLDSETKQTAIYDILQIENLEQRVDLWEENGQIYFKEYDGEDQVYKIADEYGDVVKRVMNG